MFAGFSCELLSVLLEETGTTEVVPVGSSRNDIFGFLID